ncbi:MAG: gamma subclass chorismate mutase AroQ [Gammaproteobacteria bacterium]
MRFTSFCQTRSGPQPYLVSGLIVLCAAWLSAGLFVSPIASAEEEPFKPVEQVDRTAESVANLLYERLSWMREIAAWKWIHKVRIEDKAREQQLLVRLKGQAKDLGIDPAGMERIFLIQFDMAKSIQRYWHNRWTLTGFPEDWAPKDLITQIRPKISQLSNQILVAIYLNVHNLRYPEDSRFPNMHRLTEFPLSVDLVLELERSLKGISLLEWHEVGLLKRVRTSGLLRVGTTGDYPPFTTQDGILWDGIDLQLARLLARSLRAEVVVVPTSWPTLMEDMVNNRFDIGMGGISVVRDRRRAGFFSDPYFLGGKQLIGRCSDADFFRSIRQVDQAGVRVVVNPGGTNQQYVDENIHQATIIVHPDNKTIFNTLIQNQADVMITDAAEVRWQTANNPELCALSKRRLTKSSKAYWAQKDKEFVGEVNTWLERMRRSGQLNRIIDLYFEPEPQAK